jgi:protein O-GlcNAc transferase
MDLLARGLQHHRAGQHAEAERLYREVLARAPDHPHAVLLLGVLAVQCARIDEAVAMLERATALAPGNAACHANLGEALRRRGDPGAAIDALLRAITIDPEAVDPLYALGGLLHDRGAFDGAIACLERAEELRPGLPDVAARTASARAAIAARDELRTSEASEASDEASAGVAEDVLSAAALLALARPVAVKGRLQEAATMLERAAALNPRLTVAHANLGMLKAALGRVSEACASYRRALAIEPDLAETHHNLGNALLRGGRLAEAIASFRSAVAASPERAAYRSDLVFHLHFDPGYDAHAILAEAREWEHAHTSGLAPMPSRLERERAPERRLRVGYVSPNFRRHCQAFFMSPLLANHDHEHFEIVCYSDLARPDEWTERLLGYADRAVAVHAMSDAALADRIAEDGIDILVDLTMHMAEGRLLTFARKPAPIQVSWLAYPGTTGLSAIDHRVSDPHLDPYSDPPHGDASVYSERTLRLPDCFWCYDPLASESVGPLPAKRQGHVAFGSLNNLLKVGEPCVALWARVLRRVASSTLTLLAPAGDARERLLDLFEAHGVERGRVDFVEYQAREAYLATYGRIDIGLDTIPYGGHTTSLDALWMGVPVVTLVGSTVVGRAGLCHARNLELPELVAWSPEEFVNVAAGLAGDLDRLASLRSGLRQRMERSPLMDGPRFAKNLEAAYRSLWRAWCSTPGAEQSPSSPGAPRRH